MPRSGPLSPAPGCVLGRAHTFSVWALPASCPGLVLATQNIDGITGRGTSAYSQPICAPISPAPTIATRTAVVSSYSLEERVAIVTGASSGIGEATARHLAGRGLHVVLVARRKERLQTLETQITEADGRANAVE